MIELLDRFYVRQPRPPTHSQCEPGRICDTAAIYLLESARIPVLEAQYDSADFLDALQSWLQAYLGGDLTTLNDVLSLYREEKLSALGIKS